MFFLKLLTLLTPVLLKFMFKIKKKIEKKLLIFNLNSILHGWSDHVSSLAFRKSYHLKKIKAKTQIVQKILNYIKIG
jgi:hypothetical protein